MLIKEEETVKKRISKKFATGITLVVLGVIFFVLQFAEGYSEALMFFLFGAGFLIAYFYKKKYGFLIPGCLLLGLGLGTVFGRSGNLESIGLGIGFVVIYVIAYLYEKKSHWWPLIPGVILIFTGIGKESDLFSKGWPLILVFIGIFIIIREFKVSKKSKSDEQIESDKKS